MGTTRRQFLKGALALLAISQCPVPMQAPPPAVTGDFREELRRMWKEAAEAKGGAPDLLVVPLPLYEAYESYLHEQGVPWADIELADRGYENLLFRRTPVTWETKLSPCPLQEGHWRNI